MKIDSENYRIRSGHKVRLKHWPTTVKPFYASDKDYEKCLAEQIQKLEHLQGQLYALERHALLVIFQGMDAAGKDSAIKHVMSGVNPQGCQVYSFKHPSDAELRHDFLWRTTRCLPERGHVGIFNRSYYEDVLVVRVHPELLEKEGRPASGWDEKIWKNRFDSIVDFERHLCRNGTRVIKIFLHISKGEQRRRFLSRIDEPEKNWKFSMDDLKERKFWKDYVGAYEECLAATGSDHAPWFCVPADDKKNARLIVSQVIVDALKSLKMESLKPTTLRRRELAAIRTQLLKE